MTGERGKMAGVTITLSAVAQQQRRDGYEVPVSRLVQRGMSLFKVQKLLGHSDRRMTQKYAKLEPRGVADEAAALLSGGAP